MSVGVFLDVGVTSCQHCYFSLLRTQQFSFTFSEQVRTGLNFWCEAVSCGVHHYGVCECYLYELKIPTKD